MKSSFMRLTSDSDANMTTGSTHSSFDSMTLIGMSRGYKHNFVVADGQFLPVLPANVPWQKSRNENPLKGFFRGVKRLVFNKCELLFIIERDLNRNVVIYGLNKSEAGVIELPTVAFWLMIPGQQSIPERITNPDADANNDTDSESTDAETCEFPSQTHTEGLTFLEKTLAYGIAKTDESDIADEVIFIKALENQPIYVRRDDQGRFYASVIINGAAMCLRRIFICTDPEASILSSTKEVHVEVSETLRSHSSVTYYYRV